MHDVQNDTTKNRAEKHKTGTQQIQNRKAITTFHFPTVSRCGGQSTRRTFEILHENRTKTHIRLQKKFQYTPKFNSKFSKLSPYVSTNTMMDHIQNFPTIFQHILKIVNFESESLKCHINRVSWTRNVYEPEAKFRPVRTLDRRINPGKRPPSVIRNGK